MANPFSPVLIVRGGPFGSSAEVGLNSIIDATFDMNEGAILMRGPQQWQGFDPGPIPGTVLTSNGIGAPLSWTAGGSASGTVTSVSIAAANGIAGSVATPTTTPAITLSLAMFNPTAVKTSAYNAVAYDLVPVDCTSGSVTITLPTAPADKTLIAVKLIAVSGANTCTVAAGGSDVFNRVGGSATLTLSVTSQCFFVQYAAGPAIWYVIAADNSSGGYVQGSGVTITTAGGTRTIASALPALTATEFWVGNASNVATAVMMSGDATLSNAGVITVGAGAITLAKQASFAASSLMGNPTGSPASPSAITLGANLSFSGTTLVAAGGAPGGTSGQIQYDNAGSFGGFTMSGDATLVTSTGVITIGALAITTAKIAANAVTYAKMQSESASTLLGNPTGGGAVPSEITLGNGGSFSSQVLNWTALRSFTAVLGQGAAIVAGTNSAGNYLVCQFAGTFTRWDMICPAAGQPSGASLVVDVLKSANQGSTWTSLWATNTGNRPTITTGTNSGGSATAFDTTTYSAGDWLRFDVITAGGGAVQNVTLVISSRMNQ